jgi:hypothetical protein
MVGLGLCVAVTLAGKPPVAMEEHRYDDAIHVYILPSHCTLR